MAGLREICVQAEMGERTVLLFFEFLFPLYLLLLLLLLPRLRLLLLLLFRLPPPLLLF